MRHLLSQKIQKDPNFTRSTQVLRVSEVTEVMKQYIPTLWRITGTNAEEKHINLYYLRKFTSESEAPNVGEIIIADLLTTSDLAGGFNEIVEMEKIFRT